MFGGGVLVNLFQEVDGKLIFGSFGRQRGWNIETNHNQPLLTTTHASLAVKEMDETKSSKCSAGHP